MHEMTVLKNGNREHIEGPSFNNLKMDELKESMTYDTFGEHQDPDAINTEGLYDMDV